MRLLFKIILVIAIAGLSYFVVSSLYTDTSSSKDVPTLMTDQNIPTGNVEITPIPDTSNLKTIYGGTISATNFAAAKDIRAVGLDMYHLETTDGYQIMYNSLNSSFAINIERKPILTTRDLAIADLVDRLQLSMFELCSLNIYISTTVDYDDSYAGKNIGIEGC